MKDEDFEQSRKQIADLVAQTEKNNKFITRMIKFMILISVFSIIISSLSLSLNRLSEAENNQKINFVSLQEFDHLKITDTIHLVRATTYNCEAYQTDSTPNHTADGSYIDPIKLKNKEIKWVALSRDLIWDEERQNIFADTTLWRGPFAFGDTITVYSEKYPHLDGDWVVHDCMAESYRMSIDFLIDRSNNTPKLGVGTDVKIVFCQGDRRNRYTKM